MLFFSQFCGSWDPTGWNWREMAAFGEDPFAYNQRMRWPAAHALCACAAKSCQGCCWGLSCLRWESGQFCPAGHACFARSEGGGRVQGADVVSLRFAGAFGGGGASTGAFGSGFGASVAGGAAAAAPFGFGAPATSAPAFGAPAGEMHTQTHTLQRYIAHALTLTDATQQFVET